MKLEERAEELIDIEPVDPEGRPLKRLRAGHALRQLAAERRVSDDAEEDGERQVVYVTDADLNPADDGDQEEKRNSENGTQFNSKFVWIDSVSGQR